MTAMKLLAAAMRDFARAVRKAFRLIRNALVRLGRTTLGLVRTVARIEGAQAAYADWNGVLWPAERTGEVAIRYGR